VNSAYEATAWGIEYIQVEEVVSTATSGELAIYRHWIVDPDRAEVVGNAQYPQAKKDETIVRALPSLRSALSTMKMSDCTSAAATTERDSGKVIPSFVGIAKTLLGRDAQVF
jgi:hypothetical protein